MSPMTPTAARGRLPRRLTTATAITAIVATMLPLAAPVLALSTTLVINEVDYDQPSTDTTEFLEIKNVSAAPIDLDPYEVVLVNGSSGGAVIYDTIGLPPVSLAAGDFFIVCANATTVPNCDLDDGPDTNFIQNGDPDAVAIRLTGVVVDTFSYGGVTGAPYTEGSGAGLDDDPGPASGSLGRCADGADTDQNNVDFVFRPSTPGAANACSAPPECLSAPTLISAVQSSGSSTPLVGQVVVVEGIVVGDYQQSGGFGGFFVQEQDAAADADPATSEGLFVSSASAVSVGDRVSACGTASETFALTALLSVQTVNVMSSGNALPTASDVNLPVAAITDLEAFEGMRASIDQELTVTEVFTLARFGEVALSVGGRLANPTNVVDPGAPAIALQELNNRSRILLDDGSNVQNSDPVVYPQGGLSATNTLRVGDTLPGISGVLDFRFGVYRVQPVDLATIEFDHTNSRPATPLPVGGNLRVAAFNVLNFFNGDGLGGGFPTARGASTAAELTRQTQKIVNAMLALDADIYSMSELENDAGGELSAIDDLVDALNLASGAGTFNYIDTGVIGTDAIKVGILYKSAVVSPVGAHAVLRTADDPRFIDTLNRPALAQTFQLVEDGGRLTIIANHLKSKGSACTAVGDPDTGDGQGNCNVTRTNAALALVDWAASDPTASGDPDFLVVGDLNSYAKEDPIQVFTDAGYTNEIARFLGDDAYSFVFQGQSGYLDHALSSPTLTSQVTGVTEWHINADEPVALDYNIEFKSAGQVISFFDPGPYRSSDHDPVLIGIDVAHTAPATLLSPIGDGTTARAGQVLPIQFSLGGFQGLNILDGAPQVFQCEEYPDGESVDAMAAGGSGLSYDPVLDRYTFAWKTLKTWADSCRTIVVTFDDGSSVSAEVNLAR